MRKRFIRQYPAAIILLIVLFVACSKGGSDTPPPNPCAGVTITVTGTTTSSSAPGASDGSINAAATGASGLTYSLNSGGFQASGSFTGLAAGSYTVTAKSSAGCTGSASFTVNSSDPCAGKTITVNATVTNSEKCGPTGKIKVDAAGSTNFTYKLNAGGSYQADDSFSNLAPGNYTVFAKDGAGCESSKAVSIAALPNGPLFGAVVSLISSKCATCHVAGHISGLDFTVECTIVNNKGRIKTAAVDTDNMPKGGPALSASEKKTISDWITAGGLSSN